MQGLRKKNICDDSINNVIKLNAELFKDISLIEA
jgi:hypothetical protein